MAVVIPTIKGYPVLEANVLKARHTGRIWSQYELDETSFSTGFAYNGMILAVDDAAKSIKYPSVAMSANKPNVSVQYPRMFELSVGDVFHTNCVKLDGTNVLSINDTSATTTSLKHMLANGTAVYGGIDTSGYIMIDTAKPTVGPVLQAVAQDTLPNGEWAVKFAVRKA